VFTAFAPEDNMHIYGRGIRRRLAPLFKGDQERLLLAWSFLFTLPGIPMFVYGDEIAMGDDLALPGRNAVRTPMQWTAEPNAGFSPAPASQLVAPVIDRGEFDYRKINVAVATSDRNSLFQQIRKMIALRREYPALAGKSHKYDMLSDRVLALSLDQGQNIFLALHNVGSEITGIEVPIGDAKYLQDLFDKEICLRPENGKVFISIPRYGFRWFNGPKRLFTRPRWPNTAIHPAASGNFHSLIR
jgi:maltose alpha-D-glucosyltransferase/alpha-amylase